jgi:hypothetical protein
MIESLPKLAEILAETPLAQQQFAEVEILDTGENAFVVEVNSANALEAWHILQNLKTKIGRAPVLLAEFEAGSNWQQSVKHKTEIFSRFPYEFELYNSRHTDQEISPQAIINRAKTLDLESVLESYSQREEVYSSSEQLREEIERDVDFTQQNYGIAPTVSEVVNALQDKKQTLIQIESFLFHWENNHVETSNLETSVYLDYLNWYEPNSGLGIILLPTLNNWDALAYISFFGAEGFGETEKMMTVLQSWQQRFGAELVAHYGTILQFVVQHPPSTLEAAFQLAWEQYMIAPCTLELPGITLREHARALLQKQRWFLHERP